MRVAPKRYLFLIPFRSATPGLRLPWPAPVCPGHTYRALQAICPHTPFTTVAPLPFADILPEKFRWMWNLLFLSFPLTVGFSSPQIVLTSWSLPWLIGGPHFVPCIFSFPQVSTIIFLFCRFLFLL